MLLVNVSYLYRLAYLKRTLVNLFKTHDKAEQSGLTRTVGAYDTHDAVWRQREVQVIKQQLVSECLSNSMSLDDLVAQTRSVWDEYLQFLLLLLYVLVHQFVVRVKTGLTLGLTGLGSHTYPLQLTLQGLAAL